MKMVIILTKQLLKFFYTLLYGACISNILLTKTTAARNGVALSYHSVRGLYFLAVAFAATIVLCFGAG